MSGDGQPIEYVKLKLAFRAKNLMVEEFPVTEYEVYQVKRNWFWEGDVNAIEGIGRFVMGLAKEITVIRGMKFREWLAGDGEFAGKKFNTMKQ